MNGIKQGDILSSILYNFPLEYSINRVQEINLGLDMNVIHQELAFANGIRTTKSTADVLLNVCKDIDLAVNTEEIKYMKQDVIEHDGKGAYHGR